MSAACDITSRTLSHLRRLVPKAAPRGHERRRVSKLGHTTARATRLVHDNGDALALYFLAVERLFRRPAVVLVPELDHARVRAKVGLGTGGGEGTEGTAELVQLLVRVAGREVLDEARVGGRRGHGRRRVRGRVRGEHERHGRAGEGDVSALERRERALGWDAAR